MRRFFPTSAASPTVDVHTDRTDLNEEATLRETSRVTRRHDLLSSFTFSNDSMTCCARQTPVD